MSAVHHFNHTPYRTLFARRLPLLAVWGTGIALFLQWPHLIVAVSNKSHQVPNINKAFHNQLH